MSLPKDAPAAEQKVTSLDALVVTYDMRELLAQAKDEYQNIISSRELLGQDAIGSFFNLNLKDDERN